MSLKSKLNDYKRKNSIEHDKALGLHLGISQTTIHRMMKYEEASWSTKVKMRIMAKVHTVVAADFEEKQPSKKEVFTKEDAQRILKEKPIVLTRIDELRELYV